MRSPVHEQAMSSALMLALAVFTSFVGMAWLALAMPVHWEQVRGPRQLSRRAALLLRVLGTLALAGSLALCLAADHASMAALVWVMALAADALIVAFVLSWRPRWLRLLVA